jgi:hypothetical protein
MKQTFPKIHDDEILARLLECEAPFKAVSKSTASAMLAVGVIKNIISWKTERRGIPRAWQQMKDLMDTAILEGTTEVFDAFARAWTAPITKIEDVIFIGASPRAPIAVEIVSFIMLFQVINDRPPTRPEILDSMAKGDCPIDDSELCRQLKKLGWQKRIPTNADLAS